MGKREEGTNKTRGGRKPSMMLQYAIKLPKHTVCVRVCVRGRTFRDTSGLDSVSCNKGKREEGGEEGDKHRLLPLGWPFPPRC